MITVVIYKQNMNRHYILHKFIQPAKIMAMYIITTILSGRTSLQESMVMI